jgi:hypothetical protein
MLFNFAKESLPEIHVSSAHRFPNFANVPTLQEQALAKFFSDNIAGDGLSCPPHFTHKEESLGLHTHSYPFDVRYLASKIDETSTAGLEPATS